MTENNVKSLEAPVAFIQLYRRYGPKLPQYLTCIYRNMWQKQCTK